MSPKVGIVSAMEREVGPLLKGWTKGTIRDGAQVYGVWRSGSATYIACGIGREPGILATRALVESERPDILISAGFAGALTQHLRVGETITPGTVVDGHTGERFQAAGGSGVLISAAEIADETTKKQLAELYDAEAVDMEGASVASIARERGIAFCAVKSISDELGFAMPPFNAYVSADGKLALERFAVHVAVRPAYWPSLVQLARNSKRASVELSAALEHLLSKLNINTNLQDALGGWTAGARPVN